MLSIKNIVLNKVEWTECTNISENDDLAWSISERCSNRILSWSITERIWIFLIPNVGYISMHSIANYILSSNLKSVFYLCTKTSIYFDVARFFIANNGYLRTNQKGIENEMEQHIWYQELRMFTYINKHLISFSLDSSKDVGNPCSNVVLISALLVHR